MRKPGPRLTAALAAPISAATGIVINVLTDSWQWAFAAALFVLVVASAVLAALGVGQSRQTRTGVTQIASDRSHIRRSNIEATSGSNILEKASNNGTIEASFIKADSADVVRTADNGDINGSSIDAR